MPTPWQSQSSSAERVVPRCRAYSETNLFPPCRAAAVDPGERSAASPMIAWLGSSLIAGGAARPTSPVPGRPTSSLSPLANRSSARSPRRSRRAEPTMRHSSRHHQLTSAAAITSPPIVGPLSSDGCRPRRASASGHKIGAHPGRTQNVGTNPDAASRKLGHGHSDSHDSAGSAPSWAGRDLGNRGVACSAVLGGLGPTPARGTSSRCP